MRLNKIAVPVIALATFGLVACGESGTTENITNNYTTGMDIVASVADLPECSADNEGDQVWIKEKSSASICVGGKWKSISVSDTTASGYGCETEALADGSGVNIVCNGEVIGTVLNGAKGDKGDIGSTTGMEVVASVADLPKCSADNEGDQVWIKEKSSASICVGGKWESISASGATASDYGCKTEALADGSGVNIVCNGEVIGTVLNGDKGDKGDKGDAGLTTGMDIVASVADLPKCSADNEGDQVWIKEESSASICVGGKWESISASDVTASGYDCETESLADGSGVNIVCNGEVIGTVLNGDKGDKGDKGLDGKPGVGCNVVAQTAGTVTIHCGDDKFSIILNGSGEIITLVGDEKIIEIPELSGISQKGPFIKGAEVKGYELDGTRDLAQTGRSFTGQVVSDDGKFSINSVKLVSSLVLLSASGYYRNEISDSQSEYPITLYAITDLTDRSKVNVNLLTHLEYNRVAKMMKESDGSLKIMEAKKKAQKEIFAAFGIDATDFGYSEDLNIFGTDDQNAALLAISILLQGNRSEAELSSLLASFSKDIEDNGKWDDAKTRGTIAKWAADMDRVGYYGIYRRNVKYWELGSVPDFEKYLRTFWSNEYGLGICGSDTVPVGTVKNATNSNGEANKDYAATYTSQANKVRFICVDADKLRWRVAMDIEKDTLGWGHDIETGDVRNGRVNTDLVYVYEDNKWRHGTALDSIIKAAGGNACTKEHLGDYYKDAEGNYLTCAAQSTPDTLRKWVAASAFDNDTYEARLECSATGKYSDGRILDGRVNSSNKYVCDKDGFRTATADDLRAEKGCTEYTEGEYAVLSGQYSYYKCESGSWNFTLEKLNYGELTYGGRTYKTIGIKNQMWMAENLKYDPGNVSKLGKEAWSGCFENEPENCEIYGRLYTWEVAMNVPGCGYESYCKNEYEGTQGICPDGWHLPTAAEADTLLAATDNKLGFDVTKDPYGFSIEHAGYYYGYYRYGVDFVDGTADVWISTELSDETACSLARRGNYKFFGFPVRCLKNQ